MRHNVLVLTGQSVMVRSWTFSFLFSLEYLPDTPKYLLTAPVSSAIRNMRIPLLVLLHNYRKTILTISRMVYLIKPNNYLNKTDSGSLFKRILADISCGGAKQSLNGPQRDS